MRWMWGIGVGMWGMWEIEVGMWEIRVGNAGNRIEIEKMK